MKGSLFILKALPLVKIEGLALRIKKHELIVK